MWQAIGQQWNFDPAALRYIDSAIGAYLPGRAFVAPPIVEQDRVTIGAMALSGEGQGRRDACHTQV